MTVDLETFSPFDQAFIESPYETFAALREQSPVHEVDGLGYLITRFRDAVTICRNPTLWSSKSPPGIPEGSTITPRLREELAKRGGGRKSVPTLLTTDPPEHRRYRALTNPTFNVPRVRTMEDGIRALANQLIDEFATDGHVELVEQFAIRFPLLVICAQLGVPAAEAGNFAQWCKYGVTQMGGMLTPEQREEAVLGSLDMRDYLWDHIQDHRSHPQHDLIGDLIDSTIAMEEGLPPLDDDEILSIAVHYLVAGHETTAKMISSAIWLLLSHPDQKDLLEREPDLLANCVEEVLRYESPVQSMTRTSTAPTEVAGVQLAAGARAVIMNGAANRDPEMFTDPDRFDITRENARQNIAFAHGEHFCVGANLARAEGAIAIETLLQRLPNLRFTPGANDFAHQPTWVHRGLRQLHLDFDVT